MKPRSEMSMELYDMMLDRGYPEEFCDLITKNLNTDFTAGRMIGYLSHYQELPLEEIVDEMLSILADRNRIMQKKQLESNNAEWNRFLEEGIGLEINEMPVLAPRMKQELEPGMVFALEPKIVLPGIGPVGIENSWVVTAEGVEKLTLCKEEIVEL